MALDLLKQWGWDQPEVGKFYGYLQKDRVFYRGRIFECEEGDSVEYKGGRDSALPIKEDAMFNKSKETGESVCAFLNSEGGSLFWGIHDNHIIQGVELKSPVDVMLRLQQYLKSRLDGLHSDGYVKIFFHKVIHFTVDRKREPPTPPLQMDAYHQYLTEELSILREHIKKSQLRTSNDLYVIEIRARRNPTLVLFENTGYYRSQNQTMKMGLRELKIGLCAND